MSRIGIETNSARIETKARGCPPQQPRAQFNRIRLNLGRVFVRIVGVVDVVAHRTCGKDRGKHQDVVKPRAIANFRRHVGSSASTTTTHA